MPPIDLELRVTTPWGRAGQRFEFVLNSPSGAVGYHQETIRGPEVRSPEAFQARLFEQLESLNVGQDVDGAPLLQREIAQELTTIGRDLYLELFPRELRTIYREIRDRVSTLLVTTDEPWIPWELLRPAEREDDDFLCVKHQMSRWLTGEAVLVGDRHVETLLCVEAGASSGLDEVPLESAFLGRFAGQIPGLRHLVHRDPSVAQLMALLEGERFELLHFAGHGSHDPNRPNEARLHLADRMLRARNVSTAAELKLRQERPMVFFNSCQSGQLGTSLTQLGGWAERWVRRCGCSAFLAPAWCVHDPRAHRFAEVFYLALGRGHTLGEAVQHARLTLREENPGETAWLAYRVYGSPNARIRFGDHAPARLAPPVLEPRRGPSPTGEALRPPAPPFREPVQRTAATPSPGPPLASPRSHALWAMAMVFALVVVIGIGSLVPEREAQQGAAQETPDGSVVDDKPDKVDGKPIVPPPPPHGTEPSPTKAGQATITTGPRQAAPPKPAVPLAATVPGKVSIIALSEGTMAPSSSFASAFRAALLESVGGLPMDIPQVGPGPALELAQGVFQFGTSPGQTPWGAQYLLVGTASSQSLPQSVPQIRSVSLTVSAQLIRAADGTTVAHASDTHTGAGPSDAAALNQAATRCLRSITNYLDQGESP